MPQQSWTATEERQYEHIKDQAIERGSTEDRAEEIAARTVNKNRAQRGEARQQYADAQRAGIKGRSKMTKSELERALQRS
ncbi:plasmid stabilization protein [Saccharopolyspora sp. 5N102]|uniref:plasmid stabilization protein n=1 Tax=Saccharopolyspora sp. 5N102 TaxID=3375155 RepID=UPI0037879698